ncbi:TetR/AcrR family transcriptional regulator C-terminal domain-containing protein [Kitasatospora sp. CB01950]|uniref:TetR/AcrR family transcriptional regulator C-terminal domain-containing protein n=1 Tax=Kitasatospora sp. CB01950 TaxID=1703930 RepID=UPI00093EB33C|nr:TetR/AcrR family transcriptional regulator C-terminal domain-containing protein [Kitasatospora sp. CB01950]
MADRRSRPRTGLTREKILDAAIAFVDEHGPEALSTRRLGAALGVEGMTLYHYVPSKAVLLDGMVERLVLQAADEAGPAQDAPWTEVVRDTANALRAVLHRHPGMLAVIATRPVNSPAALVLFDRTLGRLHSQGVPLDLAMDVLNAAMTFTIGHTLAEIGRTPGTPAAAFESASPSDAGPHLGEALAVGAGLDFERRHHRTLAMIIDGYAALAVC